MDEGGSVTSGLAWLDSSREDQQRIRDLLNLFSESESRDELGIGQVRDAFSELLFPGTSTLHTRARYLLIVPWCFQEAQRRGGRGASLTGRVEQVERRIVGTLRAEGVTDGLIGRVAGVAVKNLPSVIYGSALLRYGIRTSDDPESLLGPGLADGAEVEELTDRVIGAWYPTLPPAPPGFPGQVEGGLDLGPAEARWLRERMLAVAPGTLLAHLLEVGHRPTADSAAPWEDPATGGAPEPPAADLRHAMLFSLAIHGAALLYNLIVAERYEQAGLTGIEDPVRAYQEAFDRWAAQAATTDGLKGWDREAMWTSVTGQNPRIASNPGARLFVDTWLDAVVSGGAAAAATDGGLRRLVESRERTVKRAQSRFVNDKLLGTWSGASGTGRLVFRWPQVRRILTDIHDGVAVPDAVA